MPTCLICQQPPTKRDGYDRRGRQRYTCRHCRRDFTQLSGSAFSGYRWPAEVILAAMRWHLSYPLSARQVAELLAEGGIDVSARTVLTWVQTFGPLLAKVTGRYRRRLGRRWYVDELFFCRGGKKHYLYRAVDQRGQVVDVLLRERRDLASAEAFFRRAVKRWVLEPDQVVSDYHHPYVKAVKGVLPGATHIRTGLHRRQGETTKSIERSHVAIRDRLRCSRGLKSVALRPGIRENECVGIMAKTLYDQGSEHVEGINAISGERCRPHPHNFTDRALRPGDPAYFDVLHSHNGYRTCYYRTFAVGSASPAMVDAYKRCGDYLDEAISLVKPGNTTADVSSVFPKAEEFGFPNEEAAFALQLGHGVGLSIWEKPVFSRLVSIEHPETIEEGMVFALETFWPASDDWSAARIEEQMVVTKDGCEVITRFRAEKLLIAGRRYYTAMGPLETTRETQSHLNRDGRIDAVVASARSEGTAGANR